MASARCTLCHRVEDWSPAEGGGYSRVERAAGGARRPSAPGRQALEVVLADGGRVVAACPACGQPMLGDDSGVLPPIAWTFALPGGAITLSPDGTGVGPEGPMARAEAAARVRAGQPLEMLEMAEQGGRWTLAFQLGLLVLMLAPIAVWLFSVFYVTLFLSHAGEAL
jgi:hypothetical protein